MLGQSNSRRNASLVPLEKQTVEGVFPYCSLLLLLMNGQTTSLSLRFPGICLKFNVLTKMIFFFKC